MGEEEKDGLPSKGYVKFKGKEEKVRGPRQKK